MAAECSSQLGKQRAMNCFPSTEYAQIVQWQEETAEIVSMISVGEVVPLGGIRDLHAILKKLRIHQVLEAHEFIDIERSLYAAKNLSQYFAANKRSYHLKHMAEMGESLVVNDGLRNQINKTIREDGYVLDSASENLSHIRKSLASLHQNIRRDMDQLAKSSSLADVLQEQIVTIRGDRLVLPVKVEHKSRVPGIVHDQSASGSTLYVEPAKLVPMNNRVTELEQEEKQEIYQILKSLSEACAGEYQTLKSNMYHLGIIDFTVGKAKLAVEMHAQAPHTQNNTDIMLKRAYHPLLARSRAVPLDLALDDETRIIVITGPNTGGKTVTLKTIGLLALMHQSGLHIPAQSESVMGIFDKVFVDIGDEQSIEQSLSTFSSHLTNIRGILEQLDAASLVLYDELGAGTDPGEGASLATAILEN
ncbi:MAG: endonuclease MutS2, partial [Peptococcaceae bacterium]|nr:endonuclease MutS2 [Peptococcaceae bacterium]